MVNIAINSETRTDFDNKQSSKSFASTRLSFARGSNPIEQRDSHPQSNTTKGFQRQLLSHFVQTLTDKFDNGLAINQKLKSKLATGTQENSIDCRATRTS
jgi:hypothetical protein